MIGNMRFTVKKGLSNDLRGVENYEIYRRLRNQGGRDLQPEWEGLIMARIILKFATMGSYKNPEGIPDQVIKGQG